MTQDEIRNELAKDGIAVIGPFILSSKREFTLRQKELLEQISKEITPELRREIQ